MCCQHCVTQLKDTRESGVACVNVVGRTGLCRRFSKGLMPHSGLENY